MIAPDVGLTLERHPAVAQLHGHFAGEHLRADVQPIAAELLHSAQTMIRAIPDCPELTVGLRKLLEARECFIRAALAAGDELGRFE